MSHFILTETTKDNEKAAVVTDGVRVQQAGPCWAAYNKNNQFHKAKRSKESVKKELVESPLLSHYCGL